MARTFQPRIALLTLAALAGCLGESFEGGKRLVYTLDLRRVPDLEKRAAGEAAETIRRRLGAYGIRRCRVKAEAPDRVIIELTPGSARDLPHTRSLIERPGRMEIRLVAGDPVDPRNVEQLRREETRFARAEEEWVEVLRDRARREEAKLPIEAPEPERPPPPEILVRERKEPVVAGSEEPETVLVDNRPGRWIDGSHVLSVEATLEPNQLRPAVAFELDEEGARAMGDLTGGHVGERLAVLLDGDVLQVATIQSKITHRAQLTGDFTDEDVQGIVSLLRGGSLPAPLVLLREETIQAEAR